MSTFAIRRQLPPAAARDPRDHLLCSGPGIASWQASVWTPADRELVCLVESEQRPDVPGAEIEKVVEVNPGEFLPIVQELEPDLEADPVAQQRGKLVVIRRSVEGWTQDDLRSAALRAMMCSFEYPELTWVRTFWSEESGRTICLFKTKDHEQAREHSARSRIPCDEVLDAVEFTAADQAVASRISARQ